MQESYFLVLDAGTGSARSIIFDERGNQISVAQQEWTHRIIPEYEGAIEFETDKNWEIVKELIRLSIKKAGVKGSQIKAISATSMREGFVIYDSNGEEIWACSNVDSRAKDEVVELIITNPALEKALYKRTGQTFSLSAIPRLLWIKKHQPEIYDKIHNFSMLSDWILYKLSGEIIVEPSNGSTSGLIDLETRNWSGEVIEKCDLPLGIYPTIVEPGSIIGKVKGDVANETGLSEKTYVVVGGGDSQVGCLGLGAVNDRDTVILGGTFWQQEVNIDKPLFHKDAKVRVNCHAAKNLWQLEGISFLTGFAMRWFRDAFCQEEKSIAKRLGIDTYSLLSEKAKGIPLGSYGIAVVFSDVMNYIKWKHSSPSILNFDINNPLHSDKYVVFRALMENAGYIALGNLLEIKSVTGFFPEVVTFAGGSSKNSFWSSLMADILGIPVRVPKVKEATALGASMLCGVATGVYDSLNDAVRSMVKIEAEYLPDNDNNKLYRGYYNQWREIYKNMLEITERTSLQPLWKAPGT